MTEPIPSGLDAIIPPSIAGIEYTQRAIPRIAKDPMLTSEIDRALRHMPTRHELHLGDGRTCDAIRPGSVHLVVTSPPYWTLKEYRDSDG